jgi:prepilin-type N-terminal cleavage/methylation domain-containing protein
MKSHLPENGFTLLEILVTIMLFGLLTSSVFYFLGQQNKLSARTSDSQEGVNLAKLTIDSLKICPYDSLVAGNDTVNEHFVRSWHVSVQQNSSGQNLGSKQIDVAINWPPSGGHTVTFATLVGDDRYKESSAQ